jgi:hypothetical protein
MSNVNVRPVPSSAKKDKFKNNIERNPSINKKRDISPGKEIKVSHITNENNKNNSENLHYLNSKMNETNKLNTKREFNTKTEKTDYNMQNIQLSDLLYKKEDDYETIVNKNMKLRSLVVQASNKLSEISEKLVTNEEEHKKEKQTIMKELDKIGQNYSKYAASHKNLIVLEEQFKKMKIDYEHNYSVLLSYQDSIR